MVNQRDNPANVVLNEKIYVLGGAPAGISVLSSMEMYDPATNVWTTEASMPVARYALAAASVNGVIYAIGGTTAVNGQGPINALAVYDPVTNLWNSTVPSTPATLTAGTAGQTLAPLPTGRWGLHAVVIDGLIYAVGGAIQSSSGVNTYYGTVEVYDPVANTWTTKSPMPTPRQGMALSVVNGLIYAIGGWGGWPELAVVEVYNPVNGTWATTVPVNAATTLLNTAGTALAPMPTPRDDFGFGVVNGIIYTIAGDTNTFDNYARTPCCTNVVQAYDTLANTWSNQTPAPTIRDDFDASSVSGIIYAIAGSRDGIFSANPTPPSGSPPAPALTTAFLNANQGGYSLTTTEAFSVSTIPAPTQVTATVGTNQVTLSWNAVTGALYYNLYTSNQAGVSTTVNSTKIANIAGSPKTVTGLTAGQWVYYIVTAVTPLGESPPSSEVAVKP